MKLKFTYIVAILIIIVINSVVAQDEFRLPQASPKCILTQTIGLTDISLTYSRPGVKGRKIWGGLVPYGQVWRTGANNATTIRFTDDVLLNNEHIPAGTYSLFTIPGPEMWEIILNKDTAIWGTEGYQESGDLMRLTAKPVADQFYETFTFGFSEISTNSAKLNLNWENLKLSLPIIVEVEEKVKREIEKSIAAAEPTNWQIYAQAANYYVQQNKNHLQALEWINKSLQIKETYYNTWVKARLLAQKTEYKEAMELAKKSLKLGENENTGFAMVKPDIEKAITQWKAKRHL